MLQIILAYRQVIDIKKLNTVILLYDICFCKHDFLHSFLALNEFFVKRDVFINKKKAILEYLPHLPFS